MSRLILFLLAFQASIAQSAPLVSSQVYGAQHTDFFRNGVPGMIMAKGIDDNNAYMIEVDPVTGEIPVSASVVFSNDTNYGPVGDDTLRTAAQIGNATGAAAFGAGNSSAQTLRTVIATDQATIPTTQGGGAYADSVRNVYSSTNVTTGAWVQLIASTAALINCITVFDSSGQTLELGTGAALSESRVMIVPPGGLGGCIRLRIPASTRLSIRAISATASVGELDITGLQ